MKWLLSSKADGYFHLQKNKTDLFYGEGLVS